MVHVCSHLLRLLYQRHFKPEVVTPICGYSNEVSYCYIESGRYRGDQGLYRGEVL